MASWRSVSLEDVADEVTVGHVGPMAHEYVPFGIPFLRSQDIEPHRVKAKDLKYITPEFHSRLDKSALSPGDVVVVRTGKPGATAVIPEDMPVANCSDLVIIRPGSQLDSRFLAYYINSTGTQHVAAHLVGAVQQHFNVGSARKLQLQLPPFREQRAIALVLGALDDKIELNRRMNQTLEATARTIFTSWFLDDADAGAEDSGKAEHAPVEQSIDILTGGTPKTSIAEYWNGNIPWFSVVDAPIDSDVFTITTSKTITREGVENSATQILPRLTTIISARGTVGKCALTGVPMAMNQSCYGLRGRDGRGNYYTYFATRHIVQDLQQKGHGSVFNTITRETFRAVSFPLHSIAHTLEFDAAVTPLMERILNNLKESRTLALIRDALLPRLLSGEIRVFEAETMVEVAL